jgi:hypothetical protein
MKCFYLLLAVLILAACSKEKVYGPLKLKNGQEVEVLVSHRYGSIDDQILVLPQNASPQMPLSGFTDREPGYNYRVKAKMVAAQGPPMQDGGPADNLQFISVISKEKYDGNTPFKLALIQSYVPGGPVIMLRKQDGQYHFIPEKITLTYADDEVRKQLEEIWQYNEALQEDYLNGGTLVMKWRTITATATHDPEKFGKAYLVSHIEFTE